MQQDIRHHPAKDGVWELLDVRTSAERVRDAELACLREIARKQESEVWRAYMKLVGKG